MFDFDIDIDFGNDTKYNELDICGLVKKMKSKERKFFNVDNETAQLNVLIKQPPKSNECFKIISVSGGFSSIAIIKWIAEIAGGGIKEMFVSTFRIGKKHIAILDDLYEKELLKNVHLFTSETQKNVDCKMIYKDKEYNYFDYICEICNKNNWKICCCNNHSKILLLRTEQNFYVIETSSNLNENPKMEQFSFENDKELYDFYKSIFEGIENAANTND